ncbi:MAG: mechanosensitive ion channel protein [Mesorhizobium amorphae]|nr:MAG: mechanosensitive ion channel protein [Mesorhizobium amorphae]
MDLDPQTAYTSVQNAFNQVSALLIAYSFSFLGAVLLLVGGYFVAGLAERWVAAGLGHIHGIDLTLRSFFSKLVRYAVLALVIVMVLGQFGVQTASIIAAVGAVGLAIGLALQGTLQNIAAGVMLLVLRPLKVGEDVQVGQLRGVVGDIGLFATTLRTADGLFVLAPNSTLWNQPVTNYTRNGKRRADVVVGIGYDDDIELAQRTLLELVEGDPRVLEEPAPRTFVSALGDSSVSVTLRYWTAADDSFTVQMDLNKRVKLGFDARGISIPYPQQDVSYKSAA